MQAARRQREGCGASDSARRAGASSKRIYQHTCWALLVRTSFVAARGACSRRNKLAARALAARCWPTGGRRPARALRPLSRVASMCRATSLTVGARSAARAADRSQHARCPPAARPLVLLIRIFPSAAANKSSYAAEAGACAHNSLGTRSSRLCNALSPAVAARSNSTHTHSGA